MANGIICTNELVTASGVTFTHSTEVAGYPAENVQIYQPGESFRTSVLNPGYVEATLAAPQAMGTFAGLYTNATRHPNLLRYSNDFDNAGGDWTNNKITMGIDDTGDVPIAGISDSKVMTSDGTSGEHYVDQGFILPASQAWDYFLGSAYFMELPVAGNICIEINDGGTRYIRAFFDVTNGTFDSETRSAGTRADTGYGIESITPAVGSGDWYRIYVAGGFSSVVSTVGIRVYITDDSHNLTHSGSLSPFQLAAAMLTMDPDTLASQQSPPTYYDESSGLRAALWNVDTDSTDLEWRQVTLTDLSDWEFAHLVGNLSASTTSDTVRLNVYDPDNTDGYIEIGNLIVAQSFQPTVNIDADWSISWAEDGGSRRAPGGQLYRPVNKRYRRLNMRHSWLTEAEAMAESFEIDRKVGRSEGVLAVVDPDSDYAHQWAIWGLQDDISETMARRYVRGMSSRVYSKEWNIVEALP
jgi:hypothetical protein